VVIAEHTMIIVSGSDTHRRASPQSVRMIGSTEIKNTTRETRTRGVYFNIVLSFIFYNITNIRNVFHIPTVLENIFKKRMHSKYEMPVLRIYTRQYGFVPMPNFLHTGSLLPP
jgi:hypothetical protein